MQAQNFDARMVDAFLLFVESSDLWRYYITTQFLWQVWRWILQHMQFHRKSRLDGGCSRYHQASNFTSRHLASFVGLFSASVFVFNITSVGIIAFKILTLLKGVQLCIFLFSCFPIACNVPLWFWWYKISLHGHMFLVRKNPCSAFCSKSCPVTAIPGAIRHKLSLTGGDDYVKLSNLSTSIQYSPRLASLSLLLCFPKYRGSISDILWRFFVLIACGLLLYLAKICGSLLLERTHVFEGPTNWIA